ncbi:amino acid ABC transporter permease [Paracoccus sp. R12_1]|uniref:amino acid ABC transporter permease n=1 Tax=unclassified Paracoccus (in: a-proteobacteria) TaxID=2688777 RepID=UPI001ADB25D0|nr:MULTISPECIES: amino acid ABC transporter permease [unclassified Paracoccus (in: a-proteobacteria)]MBO9456987.1 amino acid ABC transporter permease [Paracoccus sp. R12_2]MBO9488128.1 amino acid ABC transporter permease [Paracoccus sp. R12_1]
MTQAALIQQHSFLNRVRRYYFSGARSTLLSLICFAFLAWLIWTLIDWGIMRATFDASARQPECDANGGACWSVIANRWRLIMFGLYPYEEQWRSALACLAVVVTMVLSCLPAFWTGRRLAATWFLGFATFFILMKGGILGLPLVREEQWGGLSLTLFIFTGTAVIGMPLAICLALLRSSEMPWIARTTGAVIDAVRSLPLISILFTFAIVLPFMLPGFLIGEKLYRVICGSALFFAAYQSEIIRGGMQGVAKGQDEAAKALGISYRHRVSRILLPQAFRNALPATINQFVITFMETSLVVIVGFFDLLASGNAAYGTGEWTFAFVEVYVFVAAIYFIFVFGLSRYGGYLERRMSVDQR